MPRDRLALFLMLGQTADKAARTHPDTAPSDSLPVSPSYDLAVLLPSAVRDAADTAEVYRLFFVFEQYLRDLVLEILSEKDQENWWDRVPGDVQKEVRDLRDKEDTKQWMGVGARDNISLTTYPQLLKILEDLWKTDFEPILRDKALLQEARHIAHLRNIVCHMNPVPKDEVARVKQVIRDWFRVAGP